MNAPHTQYTLTLQPIPGDDRPPEVRLRRLLKFAGRACKLRCVGLIGMPMLRVDADPLGDK